MSVNEDRLGWLDSLKLDRGAHAGANHAACVMEAVSYVAGETWTDRPACVSPIITTFLIGWNDGMDDTDRQILKPYIPRLVGTVGTSADEEARAWLLTDWLARECAPAFLRAAGLTAQEELLEALAPIDSTARARESKPRLDEAKGDANAAWTAVWDAASAAARAAARDAAWDAARAAAWAAARDAAWDAARAAAWDPARAAVWIAASAAVWIAASAAARDAASAAAWDPAWDAARAAARAAARDAARAAASAALRPTVETLQASALLLLDRLIAVGKEGS